MSKPEKTKPKKSHKELLKKIDVVREKVKKSDVYKDLCKEYGVNIDYIDLVPMAFDDIEVSARTNKGCIYFNFSLVEDGSFENEDHYMIHEMVHHFQQCFGDGPTKGSNKETYLDNEYEQEGFQAQTEYLSETRDDGTAERYVDKVMDHHDVPEKERDKRRKDLLNLAISSWITSKTAGKIDDVQERFPKLDIRSISRRDPSGRNKYLLWMAEQLSKGVKEQDLYPTIHSFHRNINHPQIKKKNIQQYKTLKELENVIKFLAPTKRERKKRYKAEGPKSEVILEEKGFPFVVVRPDNKKGCVTLGDGTNWCITMENEGYYEEYVSDNVIFYFVMRKEPKGYSNDKIAVAVARSSRDDSVKGLEYYDASDNRIGEYDLREFWGEDAFSRIMGAISADAPKAPTPPMFKFLDGKMTIEEAISFYNEERAKYFESDDPQNLTLDYMLHEAPKLVEHYGEQFFGHVSSDLASCDKESLIQNGPDWVVAHFMDDPDWRVRAEVAQYGDIETRIKMLNDPESSVRLAAAVDLCRWKHPSCEKLLNDPDETIREIAEKHFKPQEGSTSSELLNLAVEVYSKKEAGLLKVPKAWTDKLEKEVLGQYASQMWRRALELIDEGAGKKRPDGSVEELGNDELLDLYHKGESGEGEYGEFLQNLSASKDEWKKKMVELPSRKITDEMMDKIRGLSYEGGDIRGRWKREVSKEEQKEFLLKLLSESSLSESQIEGIKNDLEQFPTGYPENIVSNASGFGIGPVEFSLYVLPKELQFKFHVTRKDDDLYEVGAIFPTDEMEKDVYESANREGFGLRDHSSFFKGVDFQGNLEDTAEFAVWLAHNVLWDSYVPYFANQMDKMYDMGLWGLKDLMDLIKECRQYTVAPAEEKIKSVDLYLELWDIVHDLDAVSEYFDNLDMKRYGRTFYYALVQRGWPLRLPIKVFIEGSVKYEYRGEERSSRGLWEPSGKIISVSFDLRPNSVNLGDTPSITRKFKDSIFQAQTTMRHELQHMAQSMIKELKHLGQEAGIPSKRVRDPRESIHGTWKGEGPPEGKDDLVPHGLRDVEFYTRLTDSVNKFNRIARDWPEQFKREYAKKFVGEPHNLEQLLFEWEYSEEKRSEMSPYDVRNALEVLSWRYKEDSFFKLLRQRDVPRWRIAVREFTKATQ